MSVYQSNLSNDQLFGQQVDQYYGKNVFDKKTMKSYLSSSEYNNYLAAVAAGKSIDNATADAIANGLLKWSTERGVTHFTHWFQPIINGHTAEKHDTFMDILRDGETAISRFTAKQLIMAEPDGSSFPSGGLRATHIARGYTAWDPSSPPFVLTHANGATLYIPTMFFSWEDGLALDEKLTLLRSEQALRKETLRLFEILGDNKHQAIHTDSGLEQEFFLIDRDYYLKRPDLVAAGRSLFGRQSAKNQQLEDQYFAGMSDKVLKMLQEFETEMWKLGVPIQTRHREVAPGQYEVAPRFAESNVATDRNLILMAALQRVARQHNLAALLHEKPFKGVNGSGKHNNWSFGSNAVPSLLNPGDNPETNIQFMFFLAATVRAVDQHSDLMRVAISGAGNDHRLGANEAPPAIVSCYLGDDVSSAVERFIANDKSPSNIPTRVNLGVDYLVSMHRSQTDRNRTSTFAFTGNKFEFRAVGSSQNPSRSNQVLNTILADSIRAMANECQELINNGKTSLEVQEIVARQSLKNHHRIIFNGNGYSQEWQEEAARRGLPNLKTTPQALATYNSDKNRQLYESLSIMSGKELEARSVILYEEYVKKIVIEAKMTSQIAINMIVPAAMQYQKMLAKSVEATEAVTNMKSSAQHKLLNRVKESIDHILTYSETLDNLLASLHEEADIIAEAESCEKKIIPVMNSIRDAADTLETVVPSKDWPLPTYHQMLLHQD